MILGVSLAGEGLRIVALDADPTQAFTRWAGNAYEGPFSEALAEPDETRLAHLINSKVEEADFVLVDTAGFGNRAAAVAMTSADAVLVPALSGEADVTEAENTIRLASSPGQSSPARDTRPSAAQQSPPHALIPARGQGDHGSGPAHAKGHPLRLSGLR